MALAQAQLDTIDAAVLERTDEGLEFHLRRDCAAVIQRVVTQTAALSVVHNRTKVIWRLGENPAIFVSPDDGDRYNGWYVTIYADLGEALSDLPLRNPRGFAATVGIQHVYQWEFGDDTENSEDVFDRNVANVLRAFRRLGSLQGCPLRAIAGPKIVTKSGDATIHWFDGRFEFDLCGL